VAQVEMINEDYYMKARSFFSLVGWQRPLKFFEGPMADALESHQTRKYNEVAGAELKLGTRLSAEWKYQWDKKQEVVEKEREKREVELVKLIREEKREEALKLQQEEMLKEKSIPFEYRFDHTHVIGGSGQGKSTLIIKQFIDDISTHKHPALVIIDPKGTMVDQIRRLAMFEPDNDLHTKGHWQFPHLMIIDPTLFPPALNMFAPPKRKYAPHIQQQIENNAVSLFQYVFSSKGSALTDKQNTCFSFAVALVLTMPNANIHTLLDLMNDPVPKSGGIPPNSPFKKFIDKLGPTSKRFFYDSFYNATECASTKDQIATRIYGMLRYPTFEAMFGTTENKLDMFDCLQKGKIVLVSSPKSILGTEGSQLFSRYMVALTLQAAFERITVNKKTWHPAFLVIDEAQDVIDEIKTPEMLAQMREFRMGCTIAHQNIRGQLPEALYSSISANTRIKYAGTRSSQDASMMAKDMHCDPEFIMKQPTGSFATFVGGMTDHPFVSQFRLGQIDDWETMSDEEFDLLCKRLNGIYGVTPEKQNPPHPLGDPPSRPATVEKQKPAHPLGDLPATVPHSDPSKPAPWKPK
jgi:hypothetical protein